MSYPRRREGGGFLPGDLALADGLGYLEGPAGAVPRGEDAGEVRGHGPVHRHIAALQGQAREQVPRGHGGPQEEHAVHPLRHAAGGDGLHLVPALDGASLRLVEVHHLTADALQEVRLLPRRGGPAQHGDPLPPVEHPVAGGAVAHAPAQQLRLAGELRPPDRACRQHHGRPLDQVAAHAHVPAPAGAHGAEGPALPELRPGGGRVVPEGRQQPLPREAGEAQAVVHRLRPPEGVLLQGVGDHQGGPPAGPDVQRRRQPRRAAAHDHHIIRHAAASFLKVRSDIVYRVSRILPDAIATIFLDAPAPRQKNIPALGCFWGGILLN